MSIAQQVAARAETDNRRTGAIAFSQWAIALALSKGRRKDAAQLFAARWPRSVHLHTVQKAGIAVGTVTDTTWAGPLAELSQLGSAFIEYLRPLTVLGRLTGMRAIPFRVKVPRQTSGVSMQWVGESSPTPAGSLAFDNVEFEHSKIAGLVVISNELARLSDPAAEALVRNDLASGVAQFMDTAFLTPGLAETGISPASITNGATDVPSTGSGAAAVEADIVSLLNAVAAGSNMVAPFVIMKPTTALFLASLRTSNDQRVFPDIGASGGTILGIPVIVSHNVPSDNNSPGDQIIVALDASEILLADAGIELSSSDQATVELNDAPNSPPSASSTLISLWQHNLLGILATRYIRWAPRRSGAVAMLTGLSI